MMMLGEPTGISNLPALSGPASVALEALLRHYSLAELFWEERATSGVSTGSLTSDRYMRRERGVQLRGVGTSTLRTSWTTCCDRDGMRVALRRLGVDAPLPAWSSQEAALGTDPDVGPWEELLEERVAELQRLTNRRVFGSIRREVRLRGSAWAPGEGCQWVEARSAFTLEVEGAGWSVRRTRWGASPDPLDLACTGLVEEVSDAARRRELDPARLGGRVPVVLAPGSGTFFFHEVVGHALEADNVLAGASVFGEIVVGDLVSHPELTIHDSASAAHGAGTLPRDDEGQVPRPAPLITEGRLAGMLHDRTTAAMCGCAPTGNARRQDFRSPPRPRMRNLVVDAGTATPESLVNDIDDGLYVARMADGLVDPSSGRFYLSVVEGRRIRDGRLAEAAFDLTLDGDIRQALSSIEGIGDDVRVHAEPVTCGKDGDMVETGLAGPTVRLAPLEVKP